MPLHERIVDWRVSVLDVTIDYQSIKDYIDDQPNRIAGQRVGEGGVLELEFELERGIIRIEEPLGFMDDSAVVKCVEWTGIGSLSHIGWLEDFLECTTGEFVAVYTTTEGAMRILHWCDGQEVRHSDLDGVAISALPVHLLEPVRRAARELPGWNERPDVRYLKARTGVWPYS